MNTQATILFIPSSFEGDCVDPQRALNRNRYYRAISAVLAVRIRRKEAFELQARRLALIARNAWACREVDLADQAARLILGLPVSKEVQTAALRYQALCIHERGDSDCAIKILERITDEADRHNRALGLHHIGYIRYRRGEIDAALPFFAAAGQVAKSDDPLTQVESQWMIAVVRSIHGDHKQALRDLENLLPLVTILGEDHPLLHPDFHNSLAVELGKVGRIEEAKAAMAVALSSPAAARYPEWHETRAWLETECTSTSRSVLALSSPSSVGTTSRTIARTAFPFAIFIFKPKFEALVRSAGFDAIDDPIEWKSPSQRFQLCTKIREP